MTESAKPLLRILPIPPRHWVGDGFPVRTLFSYPELGCELSPFLLLDYAGPMEFAPTAQRRGVGEHPHRGFETVTIVYAGEVEHRDSAGGGGIIGPGDVQWMTAASGLVHEEMHGPEFAAAGGRFEMVQLWVNLPAKDKMGPPRYQGITSDRIPVVELDHGAGRARIIAGQLGAAQGPALTHSPMQVWDLRLLPNSHSTLRLPEDWNAALVVLHGQVQVNQSPPMGQAEAALFKRQGDTLTIQVADAPATVLLLAGQPLDEPIAGSGPFVMNTGGELRQAMLDYQRGLMGQL